MNPPSGKIRPCDILDLAIKSRIRDFKFDPHSENHTCKITSGISWWASWHEIIVWNLTTDTKLFELRMQVCVLVSGGLIRK